VGVNGNGEGAEVVWVSSYPKSGNTWVRFLLTNLLHGRFEESQLIHEVTPVLERVLSPHQLRTDRKNFVKTHIAYTPDLPFHEATVGAIYIVRNPLDVLASNLNYFFLTSNFDTADDTRIAAIAGQYVEAFIKHRGDPRWFQFNYGNWVQHVESWNDLNHPFPVLRLRYEDLLEDPCAALVGICDSFGLGRSEDELRAAVANSSFERMREIEEKELRERRPGMFYHEGRDAMASNGRRFMHRGKQGLGKQLLTADQIAQARTAFSPLMEQLGYV
jgi:hypothetical protein